MSQLRAVVRLEAELTSTACSYPDGNDHHAHRPLDIRELLDTNDEV